MSPPGIAYIWVISPFYTGEANMGWLTDFVSALTGDSSSKTSEAHHDARTHSGVREGKDTEHFKSAPDWADRSTESGVDLFPKDK